MKIYRIPFEENKNELLAVHNITSFYNHITKKTKDFNGWGVVKNNPDILFNNLDKSIIYRPRPQISKLYTKSGNEFVIIEYYSHEIEYIVKELYEFYDQFEDKGTLLEMIAL